DLGPSALFANTVDLVDRAGAISHVHRVCAVESNPGGYSEVSYEGHSFFEWRNPKNGAIDPTGDEHLPGAIKSDTSGIRYVTRKLRDLAVSVDPKKRHRQLLTPGAGAG